MSQSLQQGPPFPRHLVVAVPSRKPLRLPSKFLLASRDRLAAFFGSPLCKRPPLLQRCRAALRAHPTREAAIRTQDEPHPATTQCGECSLDLHLESERKRRASAQNRRPPALAVPLEETKHADSRSRLTFVPARRWSELRTVSRPGYFWPSPSRFGQ